MQGLYIYKGKAYIRPFDSKLVEVKVSKNGAEYDVKATEKTLEMDENIKKETVPATLEEAYKLQNVEEPVKEKKSKGFILD